MTSRQSAAAFRLQLWPDGPAGFIDIRALAARVERTARGRVGGVRHVSLELDTQSGAPGIGLRHCREQCLGVGVEGIPEESVRVVQLDYPAQVHHSHTVRYVTDD